MTHSPRIVVALCPYFSIRSPHLGLARIFTALTKAGYSPDVLDHDTALKNESRQWYNGYTRAANIGREFDRVTFILGLEVLLYTLFHGEAPDLPWSEILKTSPVKPVAGFEQHVADIADRITAGRYDFVLFSTYSSNLLFTAAVASALRRRGQGRVVFGGPGSSIPETAEFLLRAGVVDAVVAGEGEESIVDLLVNWSGASPPADVPGVMVMKGDTIWHIPRRLADLDSLPLTVFSGPLDGYAPVETTRGCTNRCAFCSESRFWHGHRQRSIPSVVAELRALSSRHGPLHIEFVDSLVNPSEARLAALTDGLIEARLPVDWTCDMRPVPWLNPDRAAQAFHAGCRSVNIGAETFIPRALEAMRKGTRVEWILDTIRHLTTVGIQTTVHRMCGVPGETDEEILEMYTLLREFMDSIPDLRQRSCVTWGSPDIMRVEPYSPMFRDPARWGITLVPFRLPLPPSASHLRGILDAICLHWTDGVPREEKLRRHALMRRLDRLAGLAPGLDGPAGSRPSS